MCGICPETQTKQLSTTKTEIAERRYRPATMEEFREQFRGIRHICCRRKPA